MDPIFNSPVENDLILTYSNYKVVLVMVPKTALYRVSFVLIRLDLYITCELRRNSERHACLRIDVCKVHP